MKSELQTLLSSREFRQSRGLSKLLRYVCSKALTGDSEPITEYTIAVDVLGKSQDFKESKDASVRVEVHRLRKRLSEYYQREGAEHRVRIIIPIGHYTPEFVIQEHLPAVEAEADVELATAVVAFEEAPVVMPPEPLGEPVPTILPMVESQGRPWWRQPSRIALVVLAVATLALTVRLMAMTEDPLDSLWRPVLNSPTPTLICMGNVAGGQPNPPDPIDTSRISLLDFHNMKSQTVLVDDALTMARFAGLLESKHKRYRVVTQTEATFADLQNGPAVLIGLANNDWTERLVGKLRFSVKRTTPGGKMYLSDQRQPGKTDWSIDYAAPYLEVTRDYALVMRVLDPKTEQVVISAAGISVFGTLTAGEFLTNPDEFRKIEAVAPKGWRKMNFEMVLSTDVIRGKSGKANIVASHFW